MFRSSRRQVKESKLREIDGFICKKGKEKEGGGRRELGFSESFHDEKNFHQSANPSNQLQMSGPTLSPASRVDRCPAPEMISSWDLGILPAIS